MVPQARNLNHRHYNREIYGRVDVTMIDSLRTSQL